jgi:hypothetical protein
MLTMILALSGSQLVHLLTFEGASFMLTIILAFSAPQRVHLLTS